MTFRARTAQDAAALIVAAQRAAPLLLIRAIRARRSKADTVTIATDEIREIALQLGGVAEIAERANTLGSDGASDV